MVVPALRRRSLVIIGVIALVAVLTGVGVFLYQEHRATESAEVPPAKPEAPPDLAKLRGDFIAGVSAAQRGDGREAVQRLSSFTFGPRMAEEYRLYYLANGHKQAGENGAARRTLVQLWRRNPRLVHAADAGFNLGGLHSQAGDFIAAAQTYAVLAARPDTPPAAAATARWQEVENRLAAGDTGGAIEAARLIVIRAPRASQAADAIAMVRSLSGLTERDPIPLNPAERLERATSLMRDGDPKTGLEELNALRADAPAAMSLSIELNRGIALNQLRRYEESTQVLEPLTSRYYKYAVPALHHLARNYRVLSASIDPTVTKTVSEKKRVGTVKVRVGKGKKKKTVSKPKYQTVKRTVKLVDLARKQKKENYERLASERLKDMLQLPIVQQVKLEVLNALIGVAQAKNQDAYVQQLVKEVISMDEWADPALQYLWDKAWSAYTKGDMANARDRLRFIADTYSSPNVRRQSEYWYARSIERLGQKEEAAAIYQRLASAPYADLYALHAVTRGAKREERTDNPLKGNRIDWPEMAEKQIPAELRLAYELTALSDYRDARLEIQKNINRENNRYGEALLADLYHSTGSPQLMYRSIRRAWPQLATVDQDTVPAYFLRMYYPVKYEEAIRENAERNKIDPHLVMGLILQESYYDPKAKSRVGATGLMQIMPATGKEIAQKLRVPFGVSRLENPEVNVQLGTYYLKSMINLFGGNVYQAVASYNGGQGNVMKWRRANPGRPNDEFLESIPFPETRNYVKRVTMLRSAYSRITA